MHTLQLKNKRGKVVATLQWERPEDLINWANATANENGKEFRNVDPEVPVKLEAIAAPVHKLKIVAKEQTLSVKTHSDIQTLLQSITENLHEEFEVLMCKNFVNENVLSEKKNQINVLNEITEAIINLQDLQEKTEMCLMFYGISEGEYRKFINYSVDYIVSMLTEMREARSVMLPDIFTQVLDYTVKEKQPEKEIRIAEKPLHGLTKLMEMKNSGMKFHGTWSLTEAKKEINQQNDFTDVNQGYYECLTSIINDIELQMLPIEEDFIKNIYLDGIVSEINNKSTSSDEYYNEKFIEVKDTTAHLVNKHGELDNAGAYAEDEID